MKRYALPLLPIALAVLFWGSSGCAYFPQTRGLAIDTTAADFNPSDAWVFVEGRNMGVTPATITIRRSFATTDITLRTGPKLAIIRRYEVENAVTEHRSRMDYTFGGSSMGGYRTFDVADLPKNKKGTIIIPFYTEPIQVEDREHRLTILVRNE